MKRYILFWFVLLVLAFTNGTLREVVYKNAIGEPWAHHTSVVTGIFLVGLAVWYAVKRWSFTSIHQAMLVGAIWFVLTELFEVFLILSNPNNTFADFLHAHNIAAGEMWPVFLLWVGISPVLVYKLRNRG
jgi:FtsH-binding integral membrane protein